MVNQINSSKENLSIPKLKKLCSIALKKNEKTFIITLTITLFSHSALSLSGKYTHDGI